MVLVGADFELIAVQATKRKRPFTEKAFKALFAVSAIVVASIWRKLERNEGLPRRSLPEHLLWMLAFLKVYATETILASLFHTNVRTYRDWVWSMTKAVHYLEVVR